MLAKRRRTHVGPAAKGAGEAARIEKAEFESDAPEIQAVLLNQLDRQLHAHLVQQLLVGGTGFAQLASQVTRTDVERLGDQFLGNVLLRQQHANALLDLFGEIHVGQILKHVLEGGVQSLEQKGIAVRQARLQGQATHAYGYTLAAQAHPGTQNVLALQAGVVFPVQTDVGNQGQGVAAQLPPGCDATCHQRLDLQRVGGSLGLEVGGEVCPSSTGDSCIRVLDYWMKRMTRWMGFPAGGPEWAG